MPASRCRIGKKQQHKLLELLVAQVTATIAAGLIDVHRSMLSCVTLT